MGASSVLSDDDYDVISNPGTVSLENSVNNLSLEDMSVRELPAFDDVQDRFETTRWSASEIQAYIRKSLSPPTCSKYETRRAKVYVDGSFDTFDVGHALQLRQAKLAFPSVYLIVGVFSDDLLQQNNVKATWPEFERLELVRHCRWVDEVIKDAPWEVTAKFMQEKSIDFVAIDEGASVDPSYDKTRVKAYDELKQLGKVIKTRRTIGLASQRLHRALTSVSQRATPTLSRAPSEAPPEFTARVESGPEY
ncbi:Nucleotidylyl transferase [Pholiota conissans]|uniref:choline-phosphate cytidylyltransferase n=1 Tax=Pholiota conissans TaxID=109636 RepID=A0A9P5YZ31_9AGAR|nr:Nucleotidylyl transferase [Pholiota conissans]